ncbi:hypothetical protein AGOR_G00207250 [Albula goreensis]|uniref:Ig-like domain-containing protein n=1 Tax=Albula goreensis TaxID=1534307 RepID=A0A8T3CL09_9TELE|nr:hypothetical protein AGOR_G00207250 [Albula goreensis]
MSNRDTTLLSLIALWCLSSVRSEDIYVAQGERSVKMPCPSMGSEWWYKSSLITKQDFKKGLELKGSAPMTSRAKVFQDRSLQISLPTSTDSGSYTCQGSKGETKHNLHVVSVSANPSGPFLQGHQTELRCQVSGDSKVEPKWIHPNGKDMKTLNGAFTLMSVAMADGGKWTCLITPTYNVTLTAAVLGVMPSTKVTVDRGQSAVLPCILISNPNSSSPLSTGTFSSLRLQEGNWTQLTPHSQTLLSIVEKDGACSWHSSSGSKTELQAIEEKKLVGDFSATLKNVQQSGTYSCSLNFKDRGTLITQVVLEVKGQPHGIVVPSDDGPNADVVSTKDAGDFLGLRWWIWLGIGAGSLVLIVLIIVVVYMIQRNKRMKKRAKKLRSMRKPLTANDYCLCNRVTVGRPNGRQRERTPMKERQR